MDEQTRRVALGIGVASVGLVLAAMPVFLVSGLAVQIREDLSLSAAALGAAVSGALVVGAVVGPLGGRIADRVGARGAVAAGSALSGLALAGIAGGATTWGGLTLGLAMSGVALALTDPGLAILITRAVPAPRRGLAFGVKEASIPVTTLAAGLAVPAVALTVGWRWAFTVGALPLVALAVLLPRVPLPSTNPTAAADGGGEQGPPPRATLALVAVATFVGTSAASGAGVFLTQSAVAAGWSPGAAGILLAVSSAAGVLARVGTGASADRRGGPQLGVVAWMLALGAGSMAVASVGGSLLVVGSIGLFAAGWGWTGLLFLSLVRASPDAPGTAAGFGVAGLASGNGVGPLAFGLAAQAWSFRTAWLVAAALAALAALLMRRAHARLPHPRG